MRTNYRIAPTPTTHGTFAASGEDGDFVIDGRVLLGASQGELAQNEESAAFVVKRTDGVLLARLDPTWDTAIEGDALGTYDPLEAQWPTLHLKGGLYDKNDFDPLPTPPDNSFLIEAGGEVVAYISSQDDPGNGIDAGSLVIKGRAFIATDPDPDVADLELVLYDNFNDCEWNEGGCVCCVDCPSPPGQCNCCNECGEGEFFNYDPDWYYGALDTGLEGEDQWCCDSEGGGACSCSTALDGFLANCGVYDDGIADKLIVPQEHDDIIITLDVFCETDSKAYIALRHSAGQAIILEINPALTRYQLLFWKVQVDPVTVLVSEDFPLEEGEEEAGYSFYRNHWYEFHCILDGPNLSLFYRECYTDTEGEGEDAAEHWYPLYSYVYSGEGEIEPDFRLGAGQVQTKFGLRVVHPDGEGEGELDYGRWRFDNLVVTREVD